MAGIKIKRNDKVEVIAGKDKGKQGRVLRVIAEKNRVLVEGVMMVKKARQAEPPAQHQGRHRRAGVHHPRLERHADRCRG